MSQRSLRLAVGEPGDYRHVEWTEVEISVVVTGASCVKSDIPYDTRDGGERGSARKVRAIGAGSVFRPLSGCYYRDGRGAMKTGHARSGRRVVPFPSPIRSSPNTVGTVHTSTRLYFHENAPMPVMTFNAQSIRRRVDSFDVTLGRTVNPPAGSRMHGGSSAISDLTHEFLANTFQNT